MSIAKEKSPSAATPGLQKNVAPAVTEPPSSLPEHTGCFNHGVCVKGRYDGSREMPEAQHFFFLPKGSRRFPPVSRWALPQCPT